MSPPSNFATEYSEDVIHSILCQRPSNWLYSGIKHPSPSIATLIPYPTQAFDFSVILLARWLPPAHTSPLSAVHFLFSQVGSWVLMRSQSTEDTSWFPIPSSFIPPAELSLYSLSEHPWLSSAGSLLIDPKSTVGLACQDLHVVVFSSSAFWRSCICSCLH